MLVGEVLGRGERAPQAEALRWEPAPLWLQRRELGGGRSRRAEWGKPHCRLL